MKKEKRIVLFPTEEEMLEKASELGALELSKYTDDLITRFTHLLAGSERNAIGIVNAWNLQEMSVRSGVPKKEMPIFTTVTMMYRDKIIAAIVPDKKVAEEAITYAGQIDKRLLL